ncbi:hypothetical protein D3C80_506130 [compost metagenome]
MHEDLFLDLTRVDVRAAGNIHVGGTAGDVNEAVLIAMTEIAGAEPAVAEGLGIGLGVIVIAGKNGGADDADLAGFAGCEFLARFVLNLHLHAGTIKTTGAEPRVRAIFGAVERRR